MTNIQEIPVQTSTDKNKNIWKGSQSQATCTSQNCK